MASKAKTIGSTDSTQPGTAVEERERLLHSTGEQEIRDRAYEIYLQRGAHERMPTRADQVAGDSNASERPVPDLHVWNPLGEFSEVGTDFVSNAAESCEPLFR